LSLKKVSKKKTRNAARTRDNGLGGARQLAAEQSRDGLTIDEVREITNP